MVASADNKILRGGSGGLTGNIPNGTTDCIWFGWQAMEECNLFGGTGSTDTSIRQYVWGTCIDECLQINLLQAAGPQSLPAGYYYLLQDTLYRAMALTNSSGGVVEAYDTDAYGNTIILTAPGPDNTWFTDDDTQSSYGTNSIIYCGYRYDPGSENYYVRNRFCSPLLGRWLTRDPIGLAGGISLYAYVGSSPVEGTDPSGFFAFVAAAGATDLIGGGPADLVADAIAGAILAIGGIVLVVGAVRAIAKGAGRTRDACKSRPSGQQCNACIPPVGTIGYLWHIVPPAKPHWPHGGDQLNLFDMQQSPPPVCKCFWHKVGSAEPPPLVGWVPLAPAEGGGPN